MKLIAIATAGGDAPGMNAAVRSAVRKVVSEDLRVLGFERGYPGILANESRPLDERTVGGTIHIGGTFLKTSRADLLHALYKWGCVTTQHYHQTTSGFFSI
jgi:6-phosphofructokinase 1